MCTWQRLFEAGALVGILLTLPGTASAAWPDHPNQQIVLSVSNFVLETGTAPDGSGGVIAVFHSRSNSTGQDIYAHRVNNLGQLAWGSGPVIVCNVAGDQMDIRVVPTPDGGCFVLWTDPRNGNFDVYGQKLLPSGQAVFAANGAQFVGGASGQLLRHAISDDFGGVILAYQQGSLLLARRYNSAGTSMWASPATISDTAGDNISDMISDGSGGCYVGLEREGIGTEVVIQPISLAGIPDFDQLLSLNATGNQSNIKLARRPNGNVLAVWYDGGVSPSRLVANEFVNPLVFSPNVPLDTGPAAVAGNFNLVSSQSDDPAILYGIVANPNNTRTFLARINTAGQFTANFQMPNFADSQSPDNLLETPDGFLRATFRDFTPGQNTRRLIAAQYSNAGPYWYQQVTPSDAAYDSTGKARLIHGSQNSLIVFSTQTVIPSSNTAALIRMRADGSIGGELMLPDLVYGQTAPFVITRKNRKATLTGDLIVKNNGNTPSEATTVGFYYSSTPGLGSRSFLFEVPVPALQPGQQVTLTPGLLPPKKPGKTPKVRKIKLPKEIKLMPLYLHVYIDAMNEVAEFDDNNNFLPGGAF